MQKYLAKYSTLILSFVRELDRDEMHLQPSDLKRGYVKRGDQLYQTILSSAEINFEANTNEEAKHLAKTLIAPKNHGWHIKSMTLEDLFKIEKISLD